MIQRRNLRINEIWTPIRDFENLYEISNYGRVKTIKTNKIRDGYFSNCGYKVIGLSKKSKQYVKLIHRLVIDNFIGTNDKTLTVNHIDHNKDNNNLSNLEYMKLEDNIKEAWNSGIYDKHVKNLKEMMKGNKIGSRVVYQYDLKGNFIQKWNCIKDACRHYGWHTNGHISECCRGIYKKSHGYIWKYESDVLKEEFENEISNQ